MKTINFGYRRLDQSCTIFDYPPGETSMQMQLFPNSFASVTTKQFEAYGNFQYPLEPTLRRRNWLIHVGGGSEGLDTRDGSLPGGQK